MSDLPKKLISLTFLYLFGCAQPIASVGQAYSIGDDVTKCGGAILIIDSHDNGAILYHFKTANLADLHVMSDIQLQYFHRRPDCDEAKP